MTGSPGEATTFPVKRPIIVSNFGDCSTRGNSNDCPMISGAVFGAEKPLSGGVHG